MGLWNDWMNKLADTRDNFMRGFRRFQKSSNPISQAMNTGIEVLMNGTGVGNAIGMGLEAANAGLNAATGRSNVYDVVDKMNEVHSQTGMSPAQQAQMLGENVSN